MKNLYTFFSCRKQFLLPLLCVITSGISAQTNYYVSNSGNNANNGLSPATAKATLPAAVGMAVDGDIIHLANGNYTLTATLNLNHELTIIGESEAGVIINTTGTPSGAWAINPNRSNTSLSNFTVIPNGATGGFPIHVSANTGNPLPVLNNVTLQHITINGAKKSAFDCNAVSNLTISYLTATNTISGNGIQLSGCVNVQANHITTNNNAWGGFAVYVSKPYPSGVGRGSDQILIDASTCSFGESNPVYSQDESGFVNNNITVTGYDYLIKNSTAVGYAWYQLTESNAIAFAAAITDPASSVIRKISDGRLVVGAGMKIQAAVNAASANSTIYIAAGTYHEDVTVNKTLTIQGAGIDASVVSGVVGGGSATFQLSANGIVIDGFTITRDGNTVATWNDALNSAGIAIQTAGNATISNCKFTGNRTAIDVNNSNGNSIHNNIITDNRSGLLFRNRTDQTSVVENEITNNWTVGVLFLDASGGTNSPVQSAANSVFSNNNISGNWYGQVVDRQSGGSLPAPGSNLKNFSCNWYGSLHPSYATGNSVEPGYAAQIPVAYGGTAVNPGDQPDILGTAAANIVYQPYLLNGTDNDLSAAGFQPVPNSCATPLSNVQLTASTNVNCYGASTGTATIAFENGAGAISYAVDGNTAVAINASPFTITGLPAGNHVITVTDAAGSSGTVTVHITQPAQALNASFTFTPILCNGGLSTQNVSFTGGTAPYTMANQNGGLFISGASEGVTYGGNSGNTYAANYVYTVTDAKGCQYTFNADITQPAPLSVSAAATPITCNGLSTVTVGATGGTAVYTGTGVYHVPAGIYSYTVTDANGCTATASVTPVVIPDTEKPKITAPGPYSVVNDPGQCGAILNSIGVPVTSDNCGVASVTNDHPSHFYPIGTTIVTWTVTDNSGNITDTAKQWIRVIDNERPVITALPAQNFCTNNTGFYSIPAIQASDLCGTVTVSYEITGATNRTGSGDNASGVFNPGISVIKWTAHDAVGNRATSSTTVTITSIPAASITVSGADAFCNKLVLTANATGAGAGYQWYAGGNAIASTQELNLGLTDADGQYAVTATINGCVSAPAYYQYAKEKIISNYTILATNGVDLGENNRVAGGSVGVTGLHGTASFKRNSTVVSPGSFVKAKSIYKNGAAIANPVYAAATGIDLPVMYLNTANTNRLPSKEVAAYSVSTVNGNYKNLILKKGSRTTVTGDLFGTIRVEQGAQVTFTAAVINIEKLQVVKGPRYGYSYVRFASDTKLLISGGVTIGSQVYVNPDNYKVTFYLGDKNKDDEQFVVKGGDTRFTANVYLPNGQMKVTGGYSYGDYGNGRGDCDRDDDDERYFGKGDSFVYMTGVFIAEDITGYGKNVIWNSFDCGAPPVPVLNNYTQVTQAVVTAEKTGTTAAELKVTVMPNPSSSYFTLKLESRYATPVNLRVIDAAGRVVDARSQIGSNSSLQIGQNYQSGTYYAEIVQGNKRKIVQLIKIRK